MSISNKKRKKESLISQRLELEALWQEGQNKEIVDSMLMVVKRQNEKEYKRKKLKIKV